MLSTMRGNVSLGYRYSKTSHYSFCHHNDDDESSEEEIIEVSLVKESFGHMHLDTINFS